MIVVDDSLHSPAPLAYYIPFVWTQCYVSLQHAVTSFDEVNK